MSTPLRVLIVEDSEDDALLLLRELKRGDFETTHERVSTPDGMLSSLETKTWDLILCDCVMPHFSGLEALKILKEKNADIPVIMVSGKVGEETAVSVMQAGAHDFLLKSHLFKLVPIIERELKEAESRRLRRMIEAKLVESEEKLRSLAESLPNMIFINKKGRLVYVNKKCEEIMGYKKDEFYSPHFDFTSMIAPEYRDKIKENLGKHFQGEEVSPLDYRLITKSGEQLDAEISTRLIIYEGETAILGVVTDVTARKQVESALRNSQLFLKSVLDNIPFDVFAIGKSGEYTLQNNTCLKHYGNVIGKKPAELKVDQSTIAIWENNNRRAFQGETVKEETVFAVAGEMRNIYNVVGPLQDEGEIKGILGINIDITDLKQAERAAQAALEKVIELKSIIDHSPVIAFLWLKAKGWPVDFVSENITQLGYTSKEFTSGQVSWPRITHPEDLPRLEEEVEKYLKEDTPEFTQYYRLYNKFGAIRWVEDHRRPIKNSRGEVTHIQGLISDITERKLAEDRLKESEARFRTLSEYSPMGIFQTDTKGKTVYINDRLAEMAGYSIPELLTQGWERLIYPEDKEALLENVNTAVRNKRFFEQDTRIVVRGGEVRWVRMRTSPIRSETGSVTGQVGTMVDTEQGKGSKFSFSMPKQ